MVHPVHTYVIMGQRRSLQVRLNKTPNIIMLLNGCLRRQKRVLQYSMTYTAMGNCFILNEHVDDDY
jgi:hypothetical protein